MRAILLGTLLIDKNYSFGLLKILRSSTMLILHLFNTKLGAYCILLTFNIHCTLLWIPFLGLIYRVWAFVQKNFHKVE